MNTAVINIKVHPDTKREARKVAEEMGLSLSGLINGFLRQVIRTKTITFSAREEPSEYMIKALKESQEDIKHGRVSPGFTNSEDAIAWLNNPRRKYAGKIQPKV